MSKKKKRKKAGSRAPKPVALPDGDRIVRVGVENMLKKFTVTRDG